MSIPYYLLDVSRPIEFYQAGKTQNDEDWMHYERTLDEYVLFMVLNGNLFLKVDGEPYPLAPGEVFLMRKGMHHVGYQPGVVTFYWLHFNVEQMEALTERQAAEFSAKNTDMWKIVIPAHFPLEQLDRFVILINQLIHYGCAQPKGPISDYLATSVLLEVASQFDLRPPTTRHRRFEEIVSYIRANYREELRVADIAEKFGYNDKYLAKLFRKYLGTTAKGYITHVRLLVAQRLLLSTSETVAAIAKESGFGNEYFFMQVFKKKYGVSPTQYRNTYHQQIITKYK